MRTKSNAIGIYIFVLFSETFNIYSTTTDCTNVVMLSFILSNKIKAYVLSIATAANLLSLLSGSLSNNPQHCWGLTTDFKNYRNYWNKASLSLSANTSLSKGCQEAKELKQAAARC